MLLTLRKCTVLTARKRRQKRLPFGRFAPFAPSPTGPAYRACRPSANARYRGQPCDPFGVGKALALRSEKHSSAGGCFSYPPTATRPGWTVVEVGAGCGQGVGNGSTVVHPLSMTCAHGARRASSTGQTGQPRARARPFRGSDLPEGVPMIPTAKAKAGRQEKRQSNSGRRWGVRQMILYRLIFDPGCVRRAGRWPPIRPPVEQGGPCRPHGERGRQPDPRATCGWSDRCGRL